MRGAVVAVWILVGLGVVLLGVACVGFIVGRPAALVGTFLGVGALVLLFAVLVAVFHDRMEGPLAVKLPGGGEFSVNLGQVKGNVKKAESDIKEKNLTMLSEEREEPK